MPRYKMIDHVGRAIGRDKASRETPSLRKLLFARPATRQMGKHRETLRLLEINRLRAAYDKRASRRKNPGQAPWQWGIHAWHKPRAGVSAMQDPAWRRLIRWINGGSRDDQHIDIQVHTNRTMHINGVFKHKTRAAGFVQHIEALPGATKISYENRER